MKGVFVSSGTGGHIHPALAIAKVFKKHGSKIYWIGRRNSPEEELATFENFKFKAIKASGFRGKNIFRKLLSIISLLNSFFVSFIFLRKTNPDFVLTCGNFSSLGAGIACKFLNIPLFIHEQNSVPGTANKLLFGFSDLVFEGFPDAFTKNSKVEYVGNPLREEILNLINTGSQINKSHNKKFTLLILGGSQGSVQLNSIVLKSLKNLEEIKNWKIIHQSGEIDESRLIDFYSKMKVDCKVKSYINDIGKQYDTADLVISRAGAMTVSELIYMNKPAILLPLPWATDNHQYFNAKYMKGLGLAEIVVSKKENSEILKEVISDLASNEEKRLLMAKSAKLDTAKDVAENIFKKIYEFNKEKA